MTIGDEDDGNIAEFMESKESWMQYTERLNQFLRPNDIADDGKKELYFCLQLDLLFVMLWRIDLLLGSNLRNHMIVHLVSVIQNRLFSEEKLTFKKSF